MTTESYDTSTSTSDLETSEAATAEVGSPEGSPVDNAPLRPAPDAYFGWPWLTRRRVTRFVKFGLVGASGVVVNLAVFELCFRWMFGLLTTDIRFVAANATAVVVSILTNFLLNDWWTWGDRSKGGWGDWFWRLVKYYVSASVAGVVQIGVAWASFQLVLMHLDWSIPIPAYLTQLFSILEFESRSYDPTPTLAVLVGIAVGMVINFLAAHLWAFREVDDGPDSE